MWCLEGAVAGWGWGRTPGESYSLTSQTGPRSFQVGARVIGPGMILNLHQQHTSAVALADTHTLRNSADISQVLHCPKINLRT